MNKTAKIYLGMLANATKPLPPFKGKPRPSTKVNDHAMRRYAVREASY